jgi:hypothetical protein
MVCILARINGIWLGPYLGTAQFGMTGIWKSSEITKGFNLRKIEHDMEDHLGAT